MATRFSTGLVNGMANNTGIKEAMTDGKIKIFSGSQPANADAAEQGTLLLEVTVDAGAFSHGSPTNGLEFDAPVGRVLSKAAAETWRGLGLAGGTAGWGRFVANPTDDGTLSTSLPRIDFSVGISGSGADVILSTVTIVIDQPVTVDQFNITFPV